MKKSYKKPKMRIIKPIGFNLLVGSSPLGGKDEDPFLSPAFHKKTFDDEFDDLEYGQKAFPDNRTLIIMEVQ